MDLILERVNYFQSGIINKKCARLIENSEENSKFTQKIAIGDNIGHVQIFGMKKYEIKMIFKKEIEASITQLVLGGSVDGVRDKVFLGFGTNILGFTKKGKQFLQFSTNLSENIENMYVEGANLLVTSKYIYQRYENLKDVDYIMCPDQITDVLCLPMKKVNELIAVLACRDRILRIVKGSTISYEIEVGGPPSVLCLYDNNGGLNGNEVVYGTNAGKLGLVLLSDDNPCLKWEITPDNESGSVTCINFYDITEDGFMEMLVGRDNGQIEVYHMDDAGTPFQIFEMNCNQTVTSVHGGRFGNNMYPEIVCTTYSGWIFGLTKEPTIKSVDSQGQMTIDPGLSSRIDELRQEISTLSQLVATKQKESGINNAGIVSKVAMFSVNEKFVLSVQEAAYTLSIECQAPIDNLLIQSDTAIDLLDTEKNSAVISYSRVNPHDNNCLLVTYRCQANTTRIEMKIRSIEGQYGNIRIYITPKMSTKTCQLLVIPVKPLSLHKRAHIIDLDRPFNSLTLKGKFSLVEMHSWIIFCLPETPDRMTTPGSENEVILYYESTFLGTHLECKYRKGEVVFRSDNLSTISILKDVLTKEATKKGISLDISYDISERSIEHVLKFIHPKIDSLLLLAKKVQLIEPLKELVINENTTAESFLSADYCEILSNAEQIKDQFKKQPCHLERLYGIITDLYIDNFKFQGRDVRANVKNLIDILDCYNLEKLINLFNENTTEREEA